MPLREKLSLAWLLLLFLISIVSYLPPFGTISWMLRVIVPEMGWVLVVLALPGVVGLGRNAPKLTAVLTISLAIFTLFPWLQAWTVARRLPVEFAEKFPGPQERWPLALGETQEFQKETQEYRDGLKWDVYRPNSEARARLLFVHGGSWRNGTRGDYPQMFEYLAGRGIEVVSLSYRLSGTAPYPAALQDVEFAIESLASDSKPLFLAGRSSGGHLALLAAYLHPDRLAGVIGIYPPVDMKWSFDNPSHPSVLDSRQAIVEFMESEPGENPQKFKEASPIHRLEASGPPTLLIHGGKDCLVFQRQSQMLAEKLKSLKVRHYLLELPWTEHGGDVTIWGPTGRLTAWSIESFVDSSKP